MSFPSLSSSPGGQPLSKSPHLYQLGPEVHFWTGREDRKMCGLGDGGKGRIPFSCITVRELQALFLEKYLLRRSHRPYWTVLVRASP